MTHTNKLTQKQACLFWSILAFAFIIRYVGLGSIPSGVNQDEAMAAMDAWALSLYGTDRYGMRLPVHFTAWGYGHMSVLLSYCMVIFIKLFGFNTFAIRMPMVFVSMAGIVLMYLVSKKFFSTNISLAVMALTAINPWHFMQSRWSLDCNMFPHVFLLAFYLLLCGFEKKRYLYLSMLCFGLTFYCYGIAAYTVPVFLFVFAAWCLWKKEFSLQQVCISVCIFLAVALPEILTLAINMFKLDTIETGLFTIPFFPDSVRSNDILFLNFSFYQLGRNALSLWKQVFLQTPDHLFNTLPTFGPLYHLSIPFMFLGIGAFVKSFFTEKDIHKQTLKLSFIGFLIMGIWAGLITYEVNVNRINIIFYPLIFFTVYGIVVCIKHLSKYAVTFKNAIIICYAVFAITFFTQYFTIFADEIQTMFNVDFLALIKEADALEDYDTLCISSNMGWQTNEKMAEILTQYSCKIDALYYQGLTNEIGQRTLLPYAQRYHFGDINELVSENRLQEDVLFVLYESDLESLKDSYEIILNCGDFYAVTIQ